MEKDLNQNLVEVWSSDAPRVGKSIQIKIEAVKNKKKLYLFSYKRSYIQKRYN